MSNFRKEAISDEREFKDKLTQLKRSLILKIFEGIWFVIVFGLIPFIELKLTGKSSNINGAKKVEKLVFKAASQKLHRP